MRGVAIRSMAGSSARLMKSTARSRAAWVRNSRMKKSASSKVMPMVAKTTAKSSVSPSTPDWRAIWAAMRLWGRPGPREDGQLLPAHQGVQAVDGRDAGLDEVGGIVASEGIDGAAVDVQFLLRDDARALVDGTPQAVEDPAQDVLAHRQLQALAGEAHPGFRDVQAAGGLEGLQQHHVVLHLQHVPQPHGAVGELHLHQLVVFRPLHPLQEDERTHDLFDGEIFLYHIPAPSTAISTRRGSSGARPARLRQPARSAGWRPPPPAC